MPEKPRVVILCGGLGMRLREETEYKPKPMVTAGEKPLLWHIMKIYAHYGFRSFVLCLGYRGEMIRNYFLNYRYLNSDFTLCLDRDEKAVFHGEDDISGWEITFVNTGLDTPTGGRVKRIERYIEDRTFMVTYGDGVADVDIGALLRFHKRMGRIATVTGFRPRSRFGVIEEGKGRVVKRFREKPELDALVSGGFFVFQKEIFRYLGGHSVLEREPLERLAKDGELAVYRHNGFFFSVDTYRDFLEINRMWAEGNTPWKVW